ncbi:MAG: hypothetical protein EOO65_02415 [Methanosarcinales archaeon]|nr:MAG: hypothetical protein EOO65_02415 [Methanosarcinales archaeon]
MHADRTPPAASNRVYIPASDALPVVTDAASVTVPINTSLFSDNVSPLADLKIVSVAGVGYTYGLAAACAADSDFSACTFTATTVSSLAGNAVFKVTVKDKAGNEATALYTIPVFKACT